DADELAALHPDIVEDVGGPHLPLEILARLQLDPDVARALGEPVHALQEIRYPAAIILGRDDLQVREAVEHTGENQYAERFLDLVRQDRAAHVALAPVPLALDPHAGDRVQADRHLQFLR